MAVDVARWTVLASAAAKLDVNAYDVVVLDRDLPGIHGDALCQMITSRDNQRAMVLMLTAAGLPGDRVSGLGLGADDYLAKPFHFPGAGAAHPVPRPLEASRSARPRTLRRRRDRAGPGRPDGQQGRAAGGPVRSRSSACWRRCCEPARGSWSAEHLLEQVWDEHADPFTNTVTVTVGRLRRKLGDPPVIVTTPGIGYRIG